LPSGEIAGNDGIRMKRTPEMARRKNLGGKMAVFAVARKHANCKREGG
jgi:hypothetical protein